MVGSRATRSTTVCKDALATTSVALSATSRPNTTHPTGDENLDTNAL